MLFFNLLTFTFFLLFSLLGCQGKQQASEHAESSQVSPSDSADSDVETEYTGVYSEGENYSEFKDCSSWEIYAIDSNDSRLSSAFDSLGLSSGEAMFVRMNGSIDHSGQDTLAATQPKFTITEVVETAIYDGQNACQLPQSKTFTFRGNEPFWSLTISSDSIIFNHFEHDEMAYPYVEPQWQDSVWVYNTSQDGQKLTALVSENECMDSMSGFRYHTHVYVQTPLGNFDGCGGLEGREHDNREI
ncbi:hypothetical protein WJR50_10540 [Catalinimonas sp. 4WD22]|uniref:COG3650 family protein n=1 Tax=Catalinimonas locisalis TaxID=3133978 RepID=UPI0031016E8A